MTEITDKFSDRMDVDLKISLYEYSIIRNPKTDKCIICTNVSELDDNISFGDIIDKDKAIKPNIKVQFISFSDVKEQLESASNGYFDFIGSDKKQELKDLNNNFLTHHIFSLWQYNGSFEL